MQTTVSTVKLIACLNMAIAVLANVNAAWADPPDLPHLNFAGTAGYPPGRQFENVHAYIETTANRDGDRFAKFDIYIGKESPYNLKPSESGQEEFALSFPTLKRGDELPLGNRVLTISNIVGTTASGGELVQFEELKRDVESGNFTDYFALVESNNGAGLDCKRGKIWVRKIAGSVKESGKQAKHAEIQMTINGKTRDSVVFIGDKFDFAGLRFKVEGIVSTTDTSHRYGWILLKRD